MIGNGFREPEKLIEKRFGLLVQLGVGGISLGIEGLLHVRHHEAGRNRNAAHVEDDLPQRTQAKDSAGSHRRDRNDPKGLPPVFRTEIVKGILKHATPG